MRVPFPQRICRCSIAALTWEAIESSLKDEVELNESEAFLDHVLEGVDGIERLK
jgi:hypothetical protein